MAPHLSNIARKYRDKGLKVMGLSLDDISPTLHQFVASQGDKMDYTVSYTSAVLFNFPGSYGRLACACARSAYPG